MLNSKGCRKTSFLKNKYKSEERKSRNIRGVTITDQKLPDYYESDPRMYGGTNEVLSVHKVEVLILSPKCTVFEKVIIENCEVEIEKGLTQLR